VTAIGFPDFQEQAQWQSTSDNHPGVSIAANAQSTVGPYNVQNWQSTHVRFQPTQAMRLWAQWWDHPDATGVAVADRRIEVGPNSLCSVLLVNAGRGLLLYVDNGPTPGTFDLDVSFTNRSSPAWYPLTSAPLIDEHNDAVGAGATVSVETTVAFAGPATLWTFTDAPAAPTGTINIMHGDRTGTFQELSQWRTNEANYGGGQRAQLIIPPRRIQVQFLNSDAASHHYWAVLSCDLFR
jgi:hypothetical protein